MEIISSGCSFTWGSELADATDKVPSNNAWCEIVADQLGMVNKNLSTPGGSNSEIVRKVMTDVSNNTELVMVMWTFPSRFEFLFSDNIAESFGRWKSITPWNGIDNFASISRELGHCDPAVLNGHKNNFEKSVRSGLTEFAKEYFKRVGHNIFWQQYLSFKDILLLKLFLESEGITYYFTLAHTDLITVHPDAPLEVKYLHDQIVGSINTFDGLGFDQWAKANRFAYGASHPLEEAHEQAAKYILEQL